MACAQACVCLLCVGRGEIAHAVRGDVSPIRALPTEVKALRGARESCEPMVRGRSLAKGLAQP